MAYAFVLILNTLSFWFLRFDNVNNAWDTLSSLVDTPSLSYQSNSSHFVHGCADRVCRLCADGHAWASGQWQGYFMRWDLRESFFLLPYDFGILRYEGIQVRRVNDTI